MQYNNGGWTSDYKVTVFLFGVGESIYEFKSMTHKDELRDWCIENIKLEDYVWASYNFERLIFNFKHREDAITFRLKFTGE